MAGNPEVGSSPKDTLDVTGIQVVGSPVSGSLLEDNSKCDRKGTVDVAKSA